MKETIKKSIVAGFIFSLTVFISAFTYAVWDGLNADEGDTLTSVKWNDLVDKVNGIFTDGSGNVGIGTEIPKRKLDVNGAIRFNGKCIDSGIYGDGGTQLSAALNNTYTISFNESFTSKPTITAMPECNSTGICSGFDEDGFQLTNVNTSSFDVSWIDISESSSIYYLHWMAIGPCD